MPTHATETLSCLVHATSEARRRNLTALIGCAAFDVSLDETDTLDAFREKLTAQRHDLVVTLLDEDDERLPACLLRYPDMLVLVITPARKTGPLEPWIEQGANDIVSEHRQEKLRHALARLLSECLTRAKLRTANYRLATQHKLHRILLDTRVEAVLLWQDGRVIESNQCLDSLIGCRITDNTAKGIEWKRWLSARSFNELHVTCNAAHRHASQRFVSRPINPLANRFACTKLYITSTFGQQYKTSVEYLIVDKGAAQLIRIDPNPVIEDETMTQDSQHDSVTGLLKREQFVKSLQSWFDSTSVLRCTVARIQIDQPDVLTDQNYSTDTTLQELLTYRVANLLQQRFSDCVLLARTGPNALTLVPRVSEDHSKTLAVRIKECLGAVGGLVDDPRLISVKTLTFSPNAMTAQHVLDRLEHNSLATPPVNSPALASSSLGA